VTDTDQVIFIELNTRLAIQFSPLFSQWYKKPYIDLVIDLARGITPDLIEREDKLIGTSYVFRSYKDKIVTKTPSEKTVAKLIKDAIIVHYRPLVEKDKKLSDFQQDEYTFRYALIDVVGKKKEEIDEKIEKAKQELRFEMESV